MKAKDLKQHTKSNQTYMDKEENKYGDDVYYVEGVQYKTKQDAKKAIAELIAKDFTDRLNATYKGK